MEIQADGRSIAEVGATLVAVAATGDDDGPHVRGDVGALDLDLRTALEAVGFTGEDGTTARIPAGDGTSVLAVGVGPELTLDAVRRVGAAAARAARTVASLALALPDGLDAAAATQALVEGVVLGGHTFTAHKSTSDASELRVVTVHGGADEAALVVGRTAAEATALARDLVNTPPNFKRPPALAARALELVEGTGVTARVLDGAALREGGYGGLLAVGQGSSVDPQLVELSWAPDGVEGPHVVLVGKGITFDTGGISLKPSSGMETMKMDMGGAATALAVVRAAAQMELPVRVTALLCLAENMPSGTAQRVSDVYTARGGTTVEVMNTDAEGRLVLADGIVHAGELGADVIVDVATLTGAAVIALGSRYSVLMSNDDELADELLAAGTAADEPMWRLPTATAEYRENLKSEVADIKNVGGREAGTITAGLFLHSFVPEGTRWAHLDIAGTAWSDAERGYVAKGATGTPVRTLLTWLRSR